MINIRKGTGLSLAQSDKVGLAKAGNAVVAGMLVYLDSSGYVTAVPAETNSATIASTILGFALNTQANTGADPAIYAGDGDVVSSGKIGMILLDGSSVIETDQYSGAITTFAVGTKVYAAATSETVGTITATSSSGRLIGYVYDVRYLPARRAGSQAYINYLPYNYDGTSSLGSGAGTSITVTPTLQTTTAMVAVKLAI